MITITSAYGDKASNIVCVAYLMENMYPIYIHIYMLILYYTLVDKCIQMRNVSPDGLAGFK